MGNLYGVTMGFVSDGELVRGKRRIGHQRTRSNGGSKPLVRERVSSKESEPGKSWRNAKERKRGGVGMFEVDPEERKAQLERIKKESGQKSKLGAIGSPIDDKPQVIGLEGVLLDRDEQWVTSFRLFANVRAAYGVYAEGGKWVIKDQKLFDKVDSVKREKLRPFWGKPL